MLKVRHSQRVSTDEDNFRWRWTIRYSNIRWTAAKNTLFYVIAIELFTKDTARRIMMKCASHPTIKNNPSALLLPLTTTEEHYTRPLDWTIYPIYLYIYRYIYIYIWRPHHRLTENDGHENEGQSELQDMKMTDWVAWRHLRRWWTRRGAAAERLTVWADQMSKVDRLMKRDRQITEISEFVVSLCRLWPIHMYMVTIRYDSGD